MGEVFLSRRKTFLGRKMTESTIGSLLALVAMASLALAAYMAIGQALSGAPQIFNPENPMFQLDRFSALVTALIAFASFLCCALSIAYLDELHINHGEYYALILFATAGMMLMVAAVDMLPVYLGLELMSIPIYVLSGFDRRRLRSNEAAMKYFLMGSFASAILLYGVALLYGVSGSTSFVAIRAAFDSNSSMGVAGLSLLIVGFAFKISSVPFHQWAPDVYEGAPSSVTAFMSVTVKIAAFAALLRVLALSFEPLGDLLTNVLWALAALTVVVGNLMAIIQDNVKRLLAYSSIAHAGYLLIGFVPGTVEGYSAVVFYLICYLFMNLGAFAVVVALAHHGQDCERVQSFAGLAKSRPALAALMTLFMLSLAGIPGTAGTCGSPCSCTCTTPPPRSRAWSSTASRRWCSASARRVSSFWDSRPTARSPYWASFPCWTGPGSRWICSSRRSSRSLRIRTSPERQAALPCYRVLLAGAVHAADRADQPPRDRMEPAPPATRVTLESFSQTSRPLASLTRSHGVLSSRTRSSTPPGSGCGNALGASAESAARAIASSAVSTASSMARAAGSSASEASSAIHARPGSTAALRSVLWRQRMPAATSRAASAKHAAPASER
jgi:NADH-quinone oxidoreductase subunit N